MKLTIRNADAKYPPEVMQDTVATIQVKGRIAFFEIEGRRYEIELGPELSKAIRLPD